jgi:hypothetical protein
VTDMDQQSADIVAQKTQLLAKLESNGCKHFMTTDGEGSVQRLVCVYCGRDVWIN